MFNSVNSTLGLQVMVLKRIKGISIIESLIAISILLFLFFAAFYTLGNILGGTVLTEKKTQLINALDFHVNDYMLTGNFDESASGDITFSRETIGSTEVFKAYNVSSGLSVLKRTLSPLGPTALAMTTELGPYMKAVNKLYIDAGATVIDQAEILDNINAARDQYLSNSTMKHSSNTMVMLNLGNTQLNVTMPMDDPPFDFYGPYVIVGPMTNADIDPNTGVTWKCTPYNFDSDLLPSWCNF